MSKNFIKETVMVGLGIIAGSYLAVSSFLSVIAIRQKEEILDLKEKVQELKLKNSELKKVQSSSIKLIDELASKVRH